MGQVVMAKRLTDQERLRRAVVTMLREGYATPAELATALGWSRQRVRYYGVGIDWEAARRARIERRLAWLARTRPPKEPSAR